jgi:putative adhesin
VVGPVRSRLSPWGRLVAASATVVAGAAIALLALELTSREERVASYSVRGALEGVALDLGDADVVVARGGQRPSVAVQHTDRFAFGHGARTQRSIAGGIFHVRSRCPATVMHSCSVRYRVLVPDNLPVEVRTGSGTVRLDGYRGSVRVATGSGDIDVAGFCGFSLQARAESGNVAATASCPPQELSLRSTTGSVRAVVPPGRYQVEAESASGHRSLRGISSVADAPFAIQALSSSGDVLVEGGP